MKLKLFTAVAALAFAAGTAHAAGGMMECCKDGKCCCKKDEADAEKPSEHRDHEQKPGKDD